MTYARALGLVVVASLAGCASRATLEPVVHSPLQNAWEQVPAEVSGCPDTSQHDAACASAGWWQIFHDPVLDRLMRLGLAQNLDLRLAEARIQEAQALHHGSVATLWPNLEGTAGATRGQTPLAAAGATTSSFSAAWAANWQVDLFGQLRNQARAAAASVAATQYDRDAVKMALLGQIASNYLRYRLYQLQHAIATRSADAQAEVVRITRLRFEQGAASRLDVEQVAAQLALTRAAVPQAFEQVQSARQALILLLASTPESLAEDLPATIADVPLLPRGDPLAVLQTPAQVMEQRPDVRAAQFRLVSAASSLKAAMAQRYPQLTLAGMFGTAGTQINQLMTSGSNAWSYGLNLSLPIFDFGRIRASIDAADARQLQAYLAYEQTVRGALQQVQTAIVMYTQGVLRDQHMETALNSARTAAQLARRQYQSGKLALLDVLVAEQAEYNTELAWSDAAAAVSQRLITLYQALGVAPG